MGGVTIKYQSAVLTLLSVGIAFGALGYLAGLHSTYAAPASRANRFRLHPDPVAPALRPAIAGSDPIDQWHDLANGKCAVATAEGLLSTLQQIAAKDHVLALELAAKETNWRTRTQLRNAALHGWATVFPRDAAEFALALPEPERREAIAAVFHGAANHPELAAEIASRVCAQDPSLADENGRALIDALTEVSAFPTMVHFAETDASGHRADWLNASFYRWGSADPAQARQALNRLSTSATKDAAFQGFALGWSMANPPELAAYAAQLPAGEERSFATQQALEQWMLQDPKSAAAWMSRFDPAPEFDASAATVATQSEFVRKNPVQAIGWAQSIIEPTLRESVLTELAHQLAKDQPYSARSLIAGTPGLLPEDRSVLLSGLDFVPTTEQ